MLMTPVTAETSPWVVTWRRSVVSATSLDIRSPGWIVSVTPILSLRILWMSLVRRVKTTVSPAYSSR